MPGSKTVPNICHSKIWLQYSTPTLSSNTPLHRMHSAKWLTCNKWVYSLSKYQQRQSTRTQTPKAVLTKLHVCSRTTLKSQCTPDRRQSWTVDDNRWTWINNSVRLLRCIDKTFFINRKKVLKAMMSLKWILDMFKDRQPAMSRLLAVLEVNFENNALVSGCFS